MPNGKKDNDPFEGPLTEPASPSETIWRQRWFQITLGVLVFAAMLTLVVPRLWQLLYMTRPVLVPVLIALGLAYVFNPVVVFLNHRFKLPRIAGTAVVLAGWLIGALLILVLVIPPLIYQGASLIENIKDAYPKVMLKLVEAAERAEQREAQLSGKPNHEATATTATSTQNQAGASKSQDTALSQDVESSTDLVQQADAQAEHELSRLDHWLDRLLDEDQVRQMILRFSDGAQKLQWADIGGYAVQSLDIGVGVVGSAISLTTYLIVSAVIVLFCFFYFSWKLPQMAAWFVPYLPVSGREHALELVGRMDHTVSAFVRGRLIQVSVITVVLSTGWYFCGVPYWLLLGVLGGMLNLIPYAAVISWPIAVLLAVLDALSGGNFSWTWAVILPSLVYFTAQGLDGWIVEPMVQGQATDLDPLTVMLVVLLGAAVAGLLGMLLAIPVAACVKILASELLLPKLRHLAEKY